MLNLSPPRVGFEVIPRVCVYLGRERAQPQASPAIASRLARIPASSARLCIFLSLSERRCRNRRKSFRGLGGGGFAADSMQKPTAAGSAAVLHFVCSGCSHPPPYHPPSLPPSPPGLIYGPCVRLSAESPRRIIRSAHTEGQRRGRPRVIQRAGVGGGGVVAYNGAARLSGGAPL